MFIALGIVLALVALGIAVAGEPPEEPTATTAAEASEPSASEPEATEAAEATEAPSGPVTAKVGETVQFEDSFGDHALDVTVVRTKVSTGGTFEEPDRGLWVGFHVRAKAFKDGISVPGFYALAGGQHVDATCCVSGFRPELNAMSNLNAGESAQGWVMFDLASRHGRLVMEEFLSQEAQAYWTF